MALGEDKRFLPGLEYASLKKRFLGMIVDYLAIAVTLLPFWIIPEGFETLYARFWFAFVVSYVFILEGVLTNQTIGKYVVGIQVAKDDGSKPGIPRSVVRNMIGIIGAAFGPIGFMWGAFVIYISSQNKRTGDSVAGTVVVARD